MLSKKVNSIHFQRSTFIFEQVYYVGSIQLLSKMSAQNKNKQIAEIMSN